MVSCLDAIFDFKIGKLNVLLQADLWVGHFNDLTAGHLGWCMRQQAKLEVRFFGGSISEGVVVGLLLGLQNYGGLEVLVDVWLLHGDT